MENENLLQTQGQGRRTNLQILDDKRESLAQGLVTYKQYLDVIPANKQEQFKKNFLELATQDYLLNIIEVKELIRFAVNVTKTGLDIAPSSKEVYIIPFETTINKQKVMLPQAVVPLNGMQQLAYAQGFYLILDSVFKFDDGSYESESKLSRIQQSQLRTATPKWIDTHFIGFDVNLTDLKNEIPFQTRFVDLNYVEETTKTLKMDKHKLQTWRHKAVRRAYGDFMIPKDRKIEALEKIEELNDSNLSRADAITVSVIFSKEIEDAIKTLGLVIEVRGEDAILTGKVYGKENLIQEIGFVKINGNWSMPIGDYKPNGQKQAAKPAAQKADPAVKELTNYLKNNGLTNTEMGEFVRDWLETNSSDIEGIKAILADKDALNTKVQSFLARGEGATLFDN